MTTTPHVASPSAEVHGGQMDCGSGLLLLLTRHMRAIEVGEVLLVHTEEPSVPPDLKDWSRLAGHVVLATAQDSERGPWHVSVRRGGPSAAVTTPAPVFSEGAATPVGERLWLYSNFHCNLSCDYCCTESSPQATPRLLPVEMAAQAADEFVAAGGRELLLTGGEPFLHPEIGRLVEVLVARLPLTLLTNAMLLQRGARREALAAMPRDRVTLQVSLDSAGPELHDSHRGAGSHARAVAGIGLARQLGFRVKVAATLHEGDTDGVAALHELLADWDVAAEDRLIRPVAAQGFSELGHVVTLDMLAPEPTLTTDGLWWHPVSVTDPAMRVADDPLPLAEGLAVIRDALATQDAAHREGRRHVFRCA